MTSTADTGRHAQVPSAGFAEKFSVFDPELAADPFPTLARLHAECPVARSTALGGFWVVSGYSRVREVLVDPRTFSSSVSVIPRPPTERNINDIPITIDPPDHTAYRQILGAIFGPGRINALEGGLRAHARSLAARMLAAPAGFDFLREFAVPFPAIALLKLLGLPVSDVGLLLDYHTAMISEQFSPDPSVRAGFVTRRVPEITRYIEQQVRLRLSSPFPPEDGLTTIIWSRFRGQRELDMSEIVSIVTLLISAGLETTAAQLGLHMAYLAEHAPRWRELVEHPERIPGAIEELLRVHGIVTLARQVTRDTELGGVRLRAGDRVQLLLASTGRDATAFPHPDRVDFARGPNRHLTFGGGPHRCLGSNLARLQLRIALEELTEVLPELRVLEAEREFGLIMKMRTLRLARSR